MKKTKATLIYLDNGLILTKKAYGDWREIQTEYWDHYKANLPPLSYEALVDFFQMDFKEEENWPFSREELCHFFEDNSETIRREE